MEKEAKQGLATTGGLVIGIVAGVMAEHILGKVFKGSVILTVIPLLFGVTGAIYGHKLGTRWAEKTVKKETPKK